ncbi:MAG: hypothetical protein JWR52_689 [Marmoricola sp.]|nr:hypothetical protein [Marmoricola sp.]
MSIARVVLSLSTGICWAIWQFHLARSARPGELARDAGWHAGSWFLPFANLVMPFQNVRDLWRRFVSLRTTIVTWWWTAFIVSAVLVRFAPTERPAHALHDLHVRVGFMIADSIISLGAAVLAMQIVRRLTDAGLNRSRPPALSAGASPAA